MNFAQLSQKQKDFNEKTAALRCLEPSNCWTEDFGVCEICKVNPSLRPIEPKMCVTCEPFNDYRSKDCKNCECCKQTDNYLQETAQDFIFKGYQGRSGVREHAEIWQCNRCLYCISIQALTNSPLRNALHEKARKWHKKWYCDDLKSGVVIVS